MSLIVLGRNGNSSPVYSYVSAQLASWIAEGLIEVNRVGNVLGMPKRCRSVVVYLLAFCATFVATACSERGPKCTWNILYSIT
ncbi:hypothetical protein K504DRAFT_245986 [Pleomassaria siparia CBS 279.74]|uniref:Uncharacterized protein n=1 Tax=Pleomassaria siparia CBS 279.74 TaxID=1314801 RepID=A0A6G1KBN0_9PLEO|nr:hypothetical protein K504DRAFT_245986 [Pleomassaria siparia CBS 279.74]